MRRITRRGYPTGAPAKPRVACLPGDMRGSSDVRGREQLLLSCLHALTELAALLRGEDLTSLREHLVLLLLDVVFHVLLHHRELGAPGLVLVGDTADLGHHH